MLFPPEKGLPLDGGVSIALEVAQGEYERMLRFTLSGVLTDNSLMQLWSKMMAIASSIPPCKTIVDFSSVTLYEVSSSVIALLAQCRPLQPDQPLRVFVVSTDVGFRIGRSFQMQAASANTLTNLHFVRSMDEAYKWLGIELPPKFAPIRHAWSMTPTQSERNS